MSIDTVLNDAANTIVGILTTGNPQRVLGPDDKVVLLQDYDPVKRLSPEYTKHIADAIARWQRDNRGKPNVVVHSFPQQRPLTADNPLPPQLAADIATAQFVIGTYGNPGNEIFRAESSQVNSGLLVPVQGRIHALDFKAYAVAARPVESGLVALADTDAITQARRLGLGIKAYLEAHRGKQMTVETEGKKFRVMIPYKYPIIADCFQMTEEPMINIPGGETFFNPGNSSGTVVLHDGAFYHLTDPVEGIVCLYFKNGRAVRVTEDAAGRRIADIIREHFKDPRNTFLAEMAIGTFEGALQMPLADRIYQKTCLEKIFGWHFAYGDSHGMTGNLKAHEASVHVDTACTYGRITVGREVILEQGKPQVDVFRPYMR
jgi:hypothetical protein